MYLQILNETGSSHLSNRIVDLSLDHYKDTWGDEEFWSIIVQFKGSFGKYIDKIGRDSRMISEPYYDIRSARMGLTDLYHSIVYILGDHPTMSQAIDRMKELESYDRLEEFDELFDGFSHAGR